MSPLEAWYESISAEDIIGILDDPALQKRVRRRIVWSF